MKKHFNFSNILFVVFITIILYKPSRVWVIRQFSLSPSVEKVTKNNAIIDYDWELKGLNTTNINFSELEGKVVFLNFWATWCPPCVAELPSIQKFHDAYKDKIAFVFISNENWSTINSFFIEKGYDFPIYQYKNTYLQGLPEVNSIPRTFVIDKSGNIRVDKSGSANWNSTSFRKEIDELLN